MQFNELTGATLRIGYEGGALGVLVTSTTSKWIDGLLQPSGNKVILVVAQLADGEDLDSYARSGVFDKCVPWIAPGLAAFFISQSGNAHFWITSLDRIR